MFFFLFSVIKGDRGLQGMQGLQGPVGPPGIGIKGSNVFLGFNN